MSAALAEIEGVEGQATTWFARQRSGDMSVAETQALRDWLDADLRHRLAFEAVEALWGGFEHTRDAPEVLSMRAQARGGAGRRLIWRPAAGIAAAVVLALGGWGSVQLNLWRSHELPNQTFRTDVGQRSTVTLPDGSVVTLNTDTVLRTKADGQRRLLYLDRGQAFFKVAKDRSHPFVVHAAGRTVTALGTAFDVRSDGLFEVTLVEGKVRVETPLRDAERLVLSAPAVQVTEMIAGTQFTAAGDNRWSVARADTALETAWLSGWLRFENESLGRVVAELARYSDTRIELADPQLASMPVSGRFRANDLPAFLMAVKVYDIEPAAPPRDGVIILKLAENEKS